MRFNREASNTYTLVVLKVHFLLTLEEKNLAPRQLRRCYPIATIYVFVIFNRIFDGRHVMIQIPLTYRGQNKPHGKIEEILEHGVLRGKQCEKCHSPASRT